MESSYQELGLVSFLRLSWVLVSIAVKQFIQFPLAHWCWIHPTCFFGWYSDYQKQLWRHCQIETTLPN